MSTSGCSWAADNVAEWRINLKRLTIVGKQISFRTYDTFRGSQDVTFVRSVFPKNARYHTTVELLFSDSLSYVEFFTRFRIELNLLFILCASLPSTRFPFLIWPRFLENFSWLTYHEDLVYYCIITYRSELYPVCFRPVAINFPLA